MKATTLVKRLNRLIAKYGDRPVKVARHIFNEYNEDRFSVFPGEDYADPDETGAIAGLMTPVDCKGYFVIDEKSNFSKNL